MRIEPFTEEHDALRDTIRRWVATELSPHAQAWDDAGIFPREVFTRAAELGFLGLDADPAFGGQGGDYWATVVWGEELGRMGAGSVPMALGVQTDMATPPLRKFGTAEQKRRWLEPALRGEKIAAIAISEPDAGSDVAGIRTRAVRDGDGWVLNGAKTYITNGTRADFCVMVVRTGGQPGDHDGVSLFVVDTDLPGFSVTKKLDKVGMRASDTAELSMVDVPLPAEALLGEEGMGFSEIMWQLQGERLIGAAQAIGTCEDLLDRAVTYARERHAFGRPIGTFQVQRHRLAHIVTQLEAMRRLVYDTAQGWGAGTYPTLSIAMSKLAAARTVNWIADEVLQLHGGYGYTEESEIPRIWRDNRLLRIGGGADEVQLEVIGKLLERGGITDPALREVQIGEDAGVGVQPVLTDEHEALRKSARRFVETEITPNVPAWEDARDYPRELFRKVGEAGFFGLTHDERWGGSGVDFAAKAVWVAEVARCGAGGLGADLGAHSDLAALYIDRSGTDEQRQRWLVPSITGEAIGALAITEPDAGSDVAGTTTRAVRDGGDWVINGAKTFITNGPWADHVVVVCTTDPDAGAAGKTLFVVEAGTPGFERRRLSMLGWHTGHTGELSFTDVRVPDDQRLGEVGSGFYAVMRNFAWERVMMSLGAVSAAEECLADAMSYGRERQAFGRPIGSMQTWRHRFADLATRTAMGRALTDHALRVTIAEETGTGEDGTAAQRGRAAVEAAKAKLFTQRLAVEVADWNVQIHGGAGYMREYAAQRWLRDARLGPIGGGTDEIMAEIIGKSMGF